MPSDDEDEYAPSQADEDYEDDETYSEATSRRKKNGPTASSSSHPLRTRSSTDSDDNDASASDNDMGNFPFMAPSRGHHAAWTREEDRILLECVRKHGRAWPKVVKAYSKAAKGWPSRSVQACGKRFTKLQEQAVKKQRERARRGSTSGGRGRGALQTQGNSTSAMVGRSGMASTRRPAGHRPQQRALLQSEEEEDEGEDASFAVASGSQGHGNGFRGGQGSQSQAAYPYQIQPKQEHEEGADLLWSGMSASLNGGLFAAAEDVHPTYSNANIRQGRDEVDCEVTHEEYGLTFKDVPCGSEIFIYSPHRYKIRGPLRSARARQQQQQGQQQQEEEEAAFAFQVLDGSVRAMTLPHGSTTQISFDPPSMVFCGPDSFLVVFRL